MLELKLSWLLLAIPAILVGLRFLWLVALISASGIRFADEHELRGGWRYGGYFSAYIGILMCIYAPVFGRIPNESVSRLIGTILIMIGVYALWVSRRTTLAMRLYASAASKSNLGEYSQSDSFRNIIESDLKQSGHINSEDKDLIKRFEMQESVDHSLRSIDRKIYVSAVCGGLLFLSGLILWFIEIQSGVSDPPSIKEHTAVAMFILGIMFFLPLLFKSLRALLSVKKSNK